MYKKTSLGLASLLVLGWLLAACAPAARTPQQTQAVVATEAPTAAVLPPTLQPTPLPTSYAEERAVEVEWPASMRLGESDIVRLSLIPTAGGYAVRSEFPEHQVQSQPVYVPRPSGYDLTAIARLDGVGFDLSPQGDQEHLVPPNEPVDWRWSLTPRQPGQQRLSLSLRLRWSPAAGVAGTVRQSLAYSRSLDVRILSFFGLTNGQAMTGGLLGMLLGMALCLFALVAYRKPAPTDLRNTRPNPALRLEAAPGMRLTAEEGELLRAIFNRYARVVLQSEFLSGYSGARTFLALPVRTDGRADAHTIVKIGEAEAIRREFSNFETFVKDTLPPMTARIQHAPVTISAQKGRRAALQYTFISEAGRIPASLRQTLLANPDPAPLFKLYETFGPNWWMQHRPYTFRVRQEYDCVLPTHLVVEPGRGRGKTLDAATPSGEPALDTGAAVTLHGFTHIERRADGRSLSLQGQPSAGQPPLRVRWLSLDPPEGASGQVVATRLSLLRDKVAGCDLLGLPDPLDRLPELLNETLAGSAAVIHGDLNLENILVGPGSLVWLIDFAQTREGHTLFDFAHLEAEIIAHVLAARYGSPQEFLSAVEAGDPLLSAMESIASRCLFNPDRRGEYYLAACIACLGALKFANLGDFARHLLYLRAAYLSQKL